VPALVTHVLLIIGLLIINVQVCIFSFLEHFGYPV